MAIRIEPIDRLLFPVYDRISMAFRVCGEYRPVRPSLAWGRPCFTGRWNGPANRGCGNQDRVP